MAGGGRIAKAYRQGGRLRYTPAPCPDAPDKPAEPVYDRVLLKISGEGFCAEGGFGIEAEELEAIAAELVGVAAMGVELGVVVGGGNFIRGATFAADGHIPRATADYMGMLSTVLNAVALQEMMEKLGVPTRVMSAIAVSQGVRAVHPPAGDTAPWRRSAW